MKKQKGSKIKKDETMKKKTTDKVDDEKKDQVEIKTVDEELSFMVSLTDILVSLCNLYSDSPSEFFSR